MNLPNYTGPLHPEGQKVRHILCLSGGKDSTALALYMRDKVPEMEYAFADTGEELPETYDYLAMLEAYLGKPIVRLNPDRLFKHHLDIRKGFLPSGRQRWCTELLKIKPFEDFIGDDFVYSYVGIRADENRSGYISSKANIIPVLPFKDDGLEYKDVMQLLDDSGLGLPKYYEWRSRSGCYFCFYQQRNEWVGLKERHPDLFEKAKTFERFDDETGTRFTWNQRESLSELEQPERMAQIKADHQLRLERQKNFVSADLLDILGDDDDSETGCLICHL
ncbi:phosphoadenosine phosphosulfate reductase family protein [Hymenobacter sp. NST-14]|uniref:phosphoadenosine phosphosulfate reductase family protein n=1 Tax=Hymenobacter piscis TaxID=2839984 RepID=UPI001C035F53|nr:phosphoadenosine phosphosulfate reductase family protein [Hymenobacter piscis]MBT9394805.1 phosphoadenosine phosphosulfate reductase family protein [Hymenobacter piscis]